ncbi:MAG: zinc-binding dehydrogenase [Solirubrobacteraceae bacterium]
MQAVVIEEFGPPEVLGLREVADPKLARGDVLIDVEFSNVTFVETQIRSGHAPRPSMLPQLPAILGNGVGGTVVAVGADVDDDVFGARVLATTGGTGGYAQLASVPVAAVMSIPGEVATSDAVALLADGRTALGLIDRAGIRPGDTVLVEAAAGGVGSLLVQLAKRAGARVVAAAGGEDKLEVARALGADLAVDYRRPSWTGEVCSAVGDRGVDVVFDGVGGSIGRDAFQLLARGGRLCAFGMASGSFAAITDEELNERGVARPRAAVPDQREMAALTARALSSAAAGELRAVIGQKHPLANAADAHRAIEARATIGKTLLIS